MKKERTKKICKLCDYVWLSAKEIPKECPKCKRYDWNKAEEKKEEEIKI